MPHPARLPGLWFLGHLLLPTVGLIAAILHGCNGMFYHPDRQVYREANSFPFGCEDTSFESRDGTRLHAWFLPAKGGAPKGNVLYFHGNAQNLTSHVSFVDWLPEQGFNVLVFDYRGYGRAEGSPSRSGIHEDSLAAIEHVRARKDVDPGRVVVLAQSLGGACAVAALGESGLEGIRGIALDSTFATYVGMGNEVLGGTFLTYPLAWLLLSNSHSPARSIAKIAPTPILFFHSRHDPVVPITQGRKLFEAAGEPKEFVEVSIPGHPIATETPESREKLVRFFENCLENR